MKHKLDGQGVISLPGSKSIALRALICTSFLKSKTTLSNFPLCGDTQSLLDALTVIGFSWSLQTDNVLIEPPRVVNHRPQIYIKDSAAAFRFLIFRLSGWTGMQAEVRVSPQLAERPHEPLLEMIRSMGGCIRRENDIFYVQGSDSLRFTEETQELTDQYAGQSSQYLSGLLLTAPLLQSELMIDIPQDQVSLPYIDLTLDVMSSFGENIEQKKGRLTITNNGYLNPKSYRIEEDFSSACYFWAIGALSIYPVGIRTEVEHSHQADFGFPDILEKMGAIVRRENGTITVRGNELKGIEIEMEDMPDQVPTLVLIALFADSPVKIRNISHLQYKESNRIAALIRELGKIGAEIEYKNEVLAVKPLDVVPEPVTLHTYNDHRLVMIFSILSLIYKQIRIDHPDAVSKSFPEFFARLQKIIKS